jgi:hypothetical protein
VAGNPALCRQATTLLVAAGKVRVWTETAGAIDKHQLAGRNDCSFRVLVRLGMRRECRLEVSALGVPAVLPLDPGNA